MAARYSHQLSPAAVACCLCSREALAIHWVGLRWASGVHDSRLLAQHTGLGIVLHPLVHVLRDCSRVWAP